MQAIVYETYGAPEVLHIKEVATPVPKDNEVRVRVHAATVTKYDCWMRSSTAPPGFGLMMRLSSGIRGPKLPILGTELAGEIETVGKDVNRYKPGDPVMAFSSNQGAYAEYTCLTEEAMALKPTNLSYEEAATVPYGALTALYFLRKANIQPGQKALVFGASGGLGIYAVQLAKYFGAEVTGVCSTPKMDLVKSLGADHIIDYTREDFTKNGQIYDVIFDTVGKTSVLRSSRSLKKEGTYLLATFGLPLLVQIMWLSLTSKKNLHYGLVEENPEEMNYLKDLLEAEQMRTVVDRCYPMDQAAEAHRYVETGHKMGSVVISMAPGSRAPEV